MASTFLTFTLLISISISHLLINPSLAKHHSDHDHHNHHSDHEDTENHHRHHHSDHEDHHSGHKSDEQAKPGRVKWTTKVLNEVCHKTQDYSFCTTLLSSEQTKKAEYLGQVAKISIRSALSYAKETSNKIKLLVKDGDTDKKSGGYRSCSDKYDDIIRDLKEANRFLESGDYRKVKDEARHAQQEVKGCKKAIGSADRSVQDRNNNLENHCSIIAALANI